MKNKSIVTYKRIFRGDWVYFGKIGDCYKDKGIDRLAIEPETSMGIRYLKAAPSAIGERSYRLGKSRGLFIPGELRDYANLQKGDELVVFLFQDNDITEIWRAKDYNEHNERLLANKSRIIFKVEQERHLKLPKAA